MKTKEIRKTVEQVVRVEYVADDGTVFFNKDECEKYEESALFILSKKLKRLSPENTTMHDLNDELSDEYYLEIFDIQTKEDLEDLGRYLYLKATHNGATESSIETVFRTCGNENRKDYVFENVTVGHEVMIFWNYDTDWFWVYKDGSIEGYLKWIKERYQKIVTKNITEE